jgi:hypothetical protein
LPQVVFQTPIPTSTVSLELVAVGIIVWFFALFLLERRFGKDLKELKEAVFFLLFFLGVVLLEILIF